MWVGETFADVIGFPLAGLFVAFLGAALPLAFWLDAATYLASAVLIATIVVRPAPARDTAAEVSASDPAQLTTGFVAEIAGGLHFLRADETAPLEHDPGRDRAVRASDPAGHHLDLRTRSSPAPRSDREGAWGFLETALGRRQPHRRVRHRARSGRGC